MALGKKLKVFTGNSNPPLARSIAKQIGYGLADVTVMRHPDTEIFVEYRENIRGHHVVIVQPTNTPDALAELCHMAYAAVSNSAAFVTAVIPYFGYARSDRKDKRRVAVAARLAVDQLIAAGIRRAILLDPHFEQIDGFFDPKVCQVEVLRGRPVFVNLFRHLGLTNVKNGPPDVGRAKLAEAYNNRLDGGVFFAIKSKVADEAASVTIIGDVEDRETRVVDDEISTGGTMALATEALLRGGAQAVDLVASHGKFVGKAVERLSQLPIRRFYIGDSILLRDDACEALGERLVRVTFAPLLARAIENVHNEESVSELEFEDRIAELYRDAYIVQENPV